MEKINVGVIGVGNMGQHHARIYSKLENSNLVCICDINEKRGKEIAEKYGCKYYKNYIDMLKNEKLDAVSVCVPTSLHHEVAKNVILNGINLLIEKPIAKTVEEGEELVKLAKEKNVKLTVGHIERFNPAIRKLKEMIAQNELGNITSVIARRVGLFPPQIKDADVIIDLAVHDIDVFNYLFNKTPVRVYAKSGRALINKRADFSDIFLEYEGVSGFIQVNWITPIKIRSLAVNGTRGYVELNYITQEINFYKSNYETSHNDFGDFVIKFGSPEKKIIDIKKEEPLKIELESFINCIKAGEEPLVTGEDALNSLKVAEAIIRSAKEKKVIVL